MGIMVSKDEEKTELDRMISADLRARAQSAMQNDPDHVEDSAYIQNTKKTGRYAWVWVLLVVLAIISLLCILFI